MPRIQQKLRTFVKNYIADNQRLPTQREIKQAIAQPFQFTTRPLLPKAEAVSDPAAIAQTMTGLLQDTNDIIELLREYDEGVDQLLNSIDKETEELGTKSSEVMDVLQSLSDAEEAVSLIYAGLPSAAGCSTNIDMAVTDVSLDHNLTELTGWEAEATPISSNQQLSEQVITDPMKLAEAGIFKSSVRSPDATWTGVELFVSFPVYSDPDTPDASPYQDLRAVEIHGTPSMLSFAVADPETEVWEWRDPISFDGAITYYLKEHTSNMRVRIWTQGTESHITINSMKWLVGEYAPRGTYVTMPLLLQSNGDLSADLPYRGNYLLDIKTYLPDNTNMSMEYCTLTAAELNTYYRADIGGSLLNASTLTYLPIEDSRMNIPIGYSTALLEQDISYDGNAIRGLPGFQDHIDVSITSETPAWIQTSAERANGARDIWETHLVVQEADTPTVTLGRLADHYVIKRRTGSGPALYRGEGTHELSPGIYKVICSVSADADDWGPTATPAMAEEAGLAIDTTDTITMQALPVPFVPTTMPIISSSSISSYNLTTDSLTYQHIEGLDYKVASRPPLTSTVPVAVCIRVSMSTDDPGVTPLVRRVRLMATTDIKD
jgi:hypothetical protein